MLVLRADKRGKIASSRGMFPRQIFDRFGNKIKNCAYAQKGGCDECYITNIT